MKMMEVAYYYFGGVDPEHQYDATYKTVFYRKKRMTNETELFC